MHAQTLINATPPIGAAIDFRSLDSRQGAQVHGGVGKDGLVSPYASFLVDNIGGRVRIQGARLERPELAGGTTTVYVDAVAVGSFGLGGTDTLDESYPLPESVSDREYLSVRLESDDYVYEGRGYQRCVSFRLHRVALEP